MGIKKILCDLIDATKKYKEQRQQNKEMKELYQFVSQIDNCCFWRANSKNESLMHWIISMKLLGMSNKAISTAMVLVQKKEE